MSEVKQHLINRAKFAEVLKEAHKEGIPQAYGIFREEYPTDTEDGYAYCGIGLLLYIRPDVFPILQEDRDSLDQRIVDLMHLSAQEFASKNDTDRLNFAQLADWLLTAPEVTSLPFQKDEYADVPPDWDEDADATCSTG